MRRLRLSQAKLIRLAPLRSPVCTLTISPDSNLLLAGTVGGVCCWNKSGKREWFTPVCSGTMDAIAVDSDDREVVVATGGAEAAEIVRLELETGRVVERAVNDRGPVYAIHITRSGDDFVSLHGYEHQPQRSTMISWHSSPLRPRKRRLTRTAIAWCFPSLLRIPENGFYGLRKCTGELVSLELHDVARGIRKSAWRLRSPWGWPYLSPNERLACISPLEAECPARIHDLESDAVVELGFTFRGYGRGEIVRFSADGSRIVSACPDDADSSSVNLGVWGCSNGDRIWSASHSGGRGFADAAFALDGDAVVAIDRNQPFVFDAVSGSILWTAPLPTSRRHAVRSFTVSLNQRWVAWAIGSTVYVLSM